MNVALSDKNCPAACKRAWEVSTLQGCRLELPPDATCVLPRRIARLASLLVVVSGAALCPLDTPHFRCPLPHLPQACKSGAGAEPLQGTPRDHFQNYIGTGAALSTGTGKLLRPGSFPVPLTSEIQALVHQDALKLQAKLSETLAPVRSIIANLQHIASTGIDQKAFGAMKSNFPRMACRAGPTLQQQLLQQQPALAAPSAAAAAAGGAKPQRAPLTGTYVAAGGRRLACQVAHCAACSPPWVCQTCQPGYLRSIHGTQVRAGRGWAGVQRCLAGHTIDARARACHHPGA